MSYDLFFRKRSAEKQISYNDLADYFEEREWYEVGDNQFVYTNDDTDVYFVFDYTGEDEEDSDDESGSENDPTALPVAFNLNYYRPHIFGLEAETEVTAFVRHFDLLISDPQSDGMGDGEYSPEGFLKGWNAGNEFGYQAILGREDSDEEPLTLPTETIEAVWRWNFERDAFYEEIDDDIFIPSVIFLLQEETIQSVAMWPDGIPTAIPKVDLVMMPRQELGPDGHQEEIDYLLLPYADVEPLLANFPEGERHLPYRKLSYQTPPDDVREFFQNGKSNEVDLKRVAMDAILNAELVEKYGKPS